MNNISITMKNYRAWLLIILVVFGIFGILTRTVSAQVATNTEVYPGPGINTYQSNLYTVEVYDGTAWQPSYTYKYSRKSVVAWHQYATTSVNFTTFGTNGSTQVRVSKVGSSISSIDISPKSKNIVASISNGKATFTLNTNNKVWITINNDDANPLFIFADELKPAIPSGATYFGPGIYDISPSTANHYKATTNEIIYLDGGSWVRGNIDLTGTTNVKIMGPGILSGDLWTAEDVQTGTTFNEKKLYTMIYGDWSGKNLAIVKGITIVDSPFFNFYSGVSSAYSVKILSPWYYSTDGFQAVNHVDQAFVFNGDNVFFPAWAGVNQDNVTITNSFAGNTNNAVFCGGFWGNSATNSYTAIADNIDIKTYGNPVGWGQPTPNIFQIWVDNNDSTRGYSNQTYQNIRIEGNLSQPMAQLKNMLYPWGGNVYDPALGNSYNLLFKNITLTGTQQSKSEVKGWDSLNGFHNVTFDNLKINGTQVTQSNYSTYFDTNSFVSDLNFISPPDTIPPTVSITSPINNSKVSKNTNITIKANANDDVGVSKVEFYVNDVLKCSDTVSAYTCIWTVPNTRGVVYNLKAVAFDTSNNSTNSSIIAVTSK